MLLQVKVRVLSPRNSRRKKSSAMFRIGASALKYSGRYGGREVATDTAEISVALTFGIA
jgi:hypothetical protein